MSAPYDWIRVEGAIALAKIGLRDDPEVLHVLANVAASSDYADRRAKAAQALWTFYRQLGPLIELLRENNPYRSSEAARILGDIGSNAREAVPELVRALKHKHLDVRVVARTALKKIDPKTAATAGVK